MPEKVLIIQGVIKHYRLPFYEKLYQKLIKSERLKADEAEKLWLLLLWRDELAKQRNKPRNWILKPPNP